MMQPLRAMQTNNQQLAPQNNYMAYDASQTENVEPSLNTSHINVNNTIHPPNQHRNNRYRNNKSVNRSRNNQRPNRYINNQRVNQSRNNKLAMNIARNANQASKGLNRMADQMIRHNNANNLNGKQMDSSLQNMATTATFTVLQEAWRTIQKVMDSLKDIEKYSLKVQQFFSVLEKMQQNSNKNRYGIGNQNKKLNRSSLNRLPPNNLKALNLNQLPVNQRKQNNKNSIANAWS